MLQKVNVLKYLSTITDSFYTFWLIVQSADPDFKTQCEIPTIMLFMSQQV